MSLGFIVVFDKDISLYNKLLARLERDYVYALLNVSVFTRGGRVYLLGSGSALDAAFLYSAYLRALGRGLRPEFYTTIAVKEEDLPDLVKGAGREWAEARLSEFRVAQLSEAQVYLPIAGAAAARLCRALKTC